jgi:hypothetical protein
MPRLLNRNPAYRRHRASGQAVVTIDCKDIYLGVWRSAASKAEYDRIILEWLANGRRMAQTGADITLVELLAAFSGHVRAYYCDAQSNSTSDLAHFKQVIAPLNKLFGATPAREFGPLKLEAIRNAVIQANWSRTYINNQVGNVKHIFAWGGVRRELLPPSVHQALITVPGLRPAFARIGTHLRGWRRRIRTRAHREFFDNAAALDRGLVAAGKV